MKKFIIATLTTCALIGVASTSFATDYICTPGSVGMNNMRVHVACTTPTSDGGNSITFFAVNASASADQGLANRVFTTFITALVSGRKLNVTFTAGDKTTGPTFGCAATDCRALTGLVLQ